MYLQLAADPTPSTELALFKGPKLPYFRLAVFLAFSVTDFLLTKLLLQKSHGDIYESNPLANCVLQDLGWHGLAFYKFSSVLCVVTIAIYLSLLRPHIAQRLINFACVVLGLVVVYSLFLVVNYV